MRRSILTIIITCFAILMVAQPAQVVTAQSTTGNTAPAVWRGSFSASAGLETLDQVWWPVEFGQTDLTVYVSQSQHTIGGMILDYWRANGEESVYGFPISEPFAAANGLYSQAFERGIFQYHPDWTMTDDPWIRLAPIGEATLIDKREAKRSDGRRIARDRRTAPTTPWAASDNTAAMDQTTGFTLSGAFADWYSGHEGAFYLGSPISEPFSERGVTVQYFQNGLLLENNGAVRPAALPRERPEAFGIDTTPVAQAGLQEYSEDIFVTAANPFGIDTADLPGRRRIEVNIEDQTLRAYQGDELILETLVSTGLDPNSTETGNFHVRIKRPSQTMSGFTSSTGEVVGVGGEGTPEDTSGLSTYEVEDVPNIMYFNYEAEALHGAYWHDNFGNKMSHGCVNLPLDVAEFLYQWAPLGTAVTVTE
jgi:lipoprotein-anchoring transpeptidase ErfK/SrfK